MPAVRLTVCLVLGLCLSACGNASKRYQGYLGTCTYTSSVGPADTTLCGAYRYQVSNAEKDPDIEALGAAAADCKGRTIATFAPGTQPCAAATNAGGVHGHPARQPLRADGGPQLRVHLPHDGHRRQRAPALPGAEWQLHRNLSPAARASRGLGGRRHNAFCL